MYKFFKKYSAESETSEMEWRNYMIIQFLSSEICYYSSLVFAAKCYLHPLRESTKTLKPIILDSEIDDIFRNFPEIVDSSRKMIVRIQQHVCAPTSSLKIFSEMVPGFTAYIPYITKYNNSMLTFKKLSQSSVNFKDFQQGRHSRIQTLEESLKMPIQRLEELQVLFKKLNEKQPIEEAEYILAAHSFIESICAKMKQQNEQNVPVDQHVKSVADSVKGIPEHMVIAIPHRKLIREGMMNCHTPTTKNKVLYEKRYLFLFNDALLFVKSILGGKSIEYGFVEMVKLDQIATVSDLAVERSLFEFSLIGRKEKYLFSAQTIQEKQNWVKDIQQLVTEIAKKPV